MERFSDGNELDLEGFINLGFSARLFNPGLTYRLLESNPYDPNNVTHYSEREFTDKVLSGELEAVPLEGRFVSFVGNPRFFKHEETQMVANDVFFGGGLNSEIRKWYFDLVNFLLNKYATRQKPKNYPDPHDFMHIPIESKTPKLTPDGTLDSKNIRWATKLFAIGTEHILVRPITGHYMPDELVEFYRGIGIFKGDFTQKSEPSFW